eukprot:10161907-Karenia_brevis.AAC.1
MGATKYTTAKLKEMQDDLDCEFTLNPQQVITCAKNAGHIYIDDTQVAQIYVKAGENAASIRYISEALEELRFP